VNGDPGGAPAITHPDKLLFPADGITKGELARYYASVGPLLLPHLRNRPLTMERFPAGIDKKGFIQKDVSKGFPGWLERVEIPKRGGTTWYPLINDARALSWMTNQNCITPHVWVSRVPELSVPDLCVFDLDPSNDDLATLREAALLVRALLDELALASFVKTSGSKGYHIVVPLDGSSDAEAVGTFAHGAGALLVKRHPALFTQEFIKADRGTRVLVDTGRNWPGATCAAVYAVRARPGAPVSAPCSWDEIARGAARPQLWTLRSMAERLASVGDLWAGLGEQPCSLHEPFAKIRAQLSDQDWQEAHAARVRKPKSRSAPRVERRRNVKKPS
jgi:bifunctional non-homologous end joining protein LigD